MTPTTQPRLAVPRYRIQVDNDPTFSSPDINETVEGTAYTPPKGKALEDATWYWRVALNDANGKLGPYSAVWTIHKEYDIPVLIWPQAGGTSGIIPPFTWQAMAGAAYYRLEVATSDTFVNPTRTDTLNCTYTPSKKMDHGTHYWRIQMYDLDRNPGPITSGRFRLGYEIYLPHVRAP